MGLVGHATCISGRHKIIQSYDFKISRGETFWEAQCASDDNNLQKNWCQVKINCWTRSAIYLFHDIILVMAIYADTSGRAV
jgi:hypothetical protein